MPNTFAFSPILDGTIAARIPSAAHYCAAFQNIIVPAFMGGMLALPAPVRKRRNIDALALEARRAIYRAGSSWRAMRENMRQPLSPHIAGFSDPRDLRARALADAITADAYLASYIATRLIEGN